MYFSFIPINQSQLTITYIHVGIKEKQHRHEQTGVGVGGGWDAYAKDACALFLKQNKIFRAPEPSHPSSLPYSTPPTTPLPLSRDTIVLLFS